MIEKILEDTMIFVIVNNLTNSILFFPIDYWWAHSENLLLGGFSFGGRLNPREYFDSK